MQQAGWLAGWLAGWSPASKRNIQLSSIVCYPNSNIQCVAVQHPSIHPSPHHTAPSLMPRASCLMHRPMGRPPHPRWLP